MGFGGRATWADHRATAPEKPQHTFVSEGGPHLFFTAFAPIAA